MRRLRRYSKFVTVYHSNAMRMEKADLAKPFYLQSKPWMISDQRIKGPAQISPETKLEVYPVK